MSARERRLKENLNAAMMNCMRAANHLDRVGYKQLSEKADDLIRDIGIQVQTIRSLTDANCLLDISEAVNTQHDFSSSGICLYCGAKE